MHNSQTIRPCTSCGKILQNTLMDTTYNLQHRTTVLPDPICLVNPAALQCSNLPHQPSFPIFHVLVDALLVPGFLFLSVLLYLHLQLRGRQVAHDRVREV